MKSTDAGVNVQKAMAAIKEMKTAEEIIGYTDGDTRETVLNYAEARMKTIEVAEDEDNQPNESIAQHDHMRYHRQHGIRLFLAGESIVEGWEREPHETLVFNEYGEIVKKKG